LYGLTPGTAHSEGSLDEEHLSEGSLDGEQGQVVEPVREPAGASAMSSGAVTTGSVPSGAATTKAVR